MLILTSLYYIPIYRCLPLKLPFLKNFYTLPFVNFDVKAGKIFSKRIMHTYHVVIVNNITVPSGWTSHVASILQYIATSHIFSNSMYFLQTP